MYLNIFCLQNCLIFLMINDVISHAWMDLMSTIKTVLFVQKFIQPVFQTKSLSSRLYLCGALSSHFTIFPLGMLHFFSFFDYFCFHLHSQSTWWCLPLFPCVQSFMTAAPRPSLRGSGGLGPSSTFLLQCPAPKALSVCAHAHTHAHNLSDLPPYDLAWVVTLPPSPLCRCGHQTLWRGEGVAGARPLQLHLAAICGAQHCCTFPVRESGLLTTVTFSCQRFDYLYMQICYGCSVHIHSTNTVDFT